MTNYDPSRLDRIEALVASNAKVTEANSSAITEIRAETAELRRATTAMLETVAIHQQNFEVIVNEIRNITAEIRGLQTENRRILDRLFGQDESEQQ